MTFEEWSWAATIVGVLVAMAGFPLVIWQLIFARTQREDAARLSRSQVLLAADGVLANHEVVARNLRPGGAWFGAEGSVHPTDDEMPLVEPYLGVFERIFIAVAEGQVDDATLDAFYGYRLANIWHNQRIVDEKLQSDDLKKWWRHLIALTYVVEKERGDRFPRHTDAYFPQDLFERSKAARIREGDSLISR